MIKLNGRIALPITFGDRDKMTNTMICVQMDGSEQTLLGDCMCGQKGIVTYHGDLELCQEATGTSDKAALVPIVRVQLLHSIRIPPQQSICTNSKVMGNLHRRRKMMLSMGVKKTHE